MNKKKIYLTQTLMTMIDNYNNNRTFIQSQVVRKRSRRENPEVNYAGHQNTYNFLVVIKNYRLRNYIIMILLLNIQLDTTKTN